MFNKIREIEKYIKKESERKMLNEISDIQRDNISLVIDKQVLMNLLDPEKGEYKDPSEFIKKKFLDEIP